MQAIPAKQLRELLASVPDDMLVGFMGHYGEFHALATDIDLVTIQEVYTDEYVRVGKNLHEKKRTYFKALLFPATDVGPEPD